MGGGAFDHLVALAGNPNTGKSTVFNALTGLRQHTGNWPGKTVTRAEGTFEREGARYRLVDLPGTYSLQAASADEEVARDFLLFGRPDVTVVVVDATHLERNLNLVLQILEITDRVVVCLNLMDEARRHGVLVDPARLSDQLGVPVVPAVARRGEGIRQLVDVVERVARGEVTPTPFRVRRHEPEVERAVASLERALRAAWPDLSNARWIALRLLDADERIEQSIREGELAALGAGEGASPIDPDAVEGVLEQAGRLRWTLTPDFHDRLMAGLYREAERIAGVALRARPGSGAAEFNRTLDRLLTSRWLGFPIMLAVLTVVFWLTIAGANVPSQRLADFLIEFAHPVLKHAAAAVGMPGWLDGLLLDGVYLATAWVVSVMLPPMAIFFPLFTLLEDFGYLPRVAFNLDALFRRTGAHGKQALTMCMGFGCNAAGVVATRVIDSPRERLIAIITNNFSLCNGRWPTQILMATIFLGALVPAHLAGLVSAGAVVGIALLGVAFMFATSWALSRTMLKGEASAFSLELPPYRPPRVLQTLYTSLIDRTLIVLWRAVVFAAPAGAVIWLIANVRVGDASLAAWAVHALDPVGLVLGLNGVVLLAYVVAIPANEIVIPTVLMLTVLLAGLPEVGAGAGVMFELETAGAVGGLLRAGGWTLLTGLNLMLFSLLHNPCSTTLYTIYRETRSAKWTAVAGTLPLALGVVVCFLVAQVWRLAVG
ncbi:MAG: ferrous iron transport protein B [Gemmatimonadota bacterium]|nr:ferrous iron transport protein B [Gemmatimonadota bacterium]